MARLHEFKDHPYKVTDDADMEALAESVSRHGILSPLLVRRLGDTGDEYEIISGHRRAKAAEKAVPAFVVDMSCDEATIALVEANLHRENILPSEKVFAYKMKLEAMNHQGRRTELTSVPVEQKTSREILAKQTGDSHSQIQRYIRLTKTRSPPSIAVCPRMMDGRANQTQYPIRRPPSPNTPHSFSELTFISAPKMQTVTSM